MSGSMLVHDKNNLHVVKVGYAYLGEHENVKHCDEVIRMIENGTIKTKAQVNIERKKRGIQRR